MGSATDGQRLLWTSGRRFPDTEWRARLSGASRVHGGDGALVPEVAREVRRRDRASSSGSTECVLGILAAPGFLGFSRGDCRIPEDDGRDSDPGRGRERAADRTRGVAGSARGGSDSRGRDLRWEASSPRSRQRCRKLGPAGGYPSGILCVNRRRDLSCPTPRGSREPPISDPITRLEGRYRTEREPTEEAVRCSSVS